MPKEVNTRESYFVIGTAVNEDYTLDNPLYLPPPTTVPHSNEFLTDAQRNANGTMIFQQIGRTQYTSDLTWNILKNTKWWEINRWFEQFGYAFYAKYFNHAEGRIKIQRFYRGNVTKATPSPNQEILNGVSVPKKYLQCGFNIIDMGEDEVIVVEEMAVRV